GGLVEPSAGSVEWHGRALSSVDRAARGALRATGIAYVFQGANLLPHFTALENVAFAAQLSRGDAEPALAAPALLELVGIAAQLALTGVVRAPGRTALRVLTLAAAVGLLAAVVLFVGHSLGTMTASAARSVPVDWQGPVGSYSTATRIARGVARQAGIGEA